MGIYTNFSGYYGSSSNYTDVQPFVGESFNYHELGIIAATEMAANHNAFMKGIALSELAAVEQTGSTDILYESVNLKGIFEKIKMFFKSIIEKIHKIFHTFVAKMTSWFGGNSDFVKKYEKEVIKGWANVKSDWEFKGYNYKKAMDLKPPANDLKCQAAGKAIENLLNGDLSKYVKGTDSNAGKIASADPKDPDENVDMTADGELAKYREKLDDIKSGLRKAIADKVTADSSAELPTTFVIKLDASGGYDQSEFTEELFKGLRGGEDSKQDLKKSDIEACYGSMSGMMSYIKSFDKTKKNLESSEKNITGGIDKLIKNIDKEEDKILKDTTNSDREKVVQAASFYQSVWGAISEMVTQAFSAVLQANKDACSQAKEIAVKVIGQSKKMTEESYDYSSSGDFDFISSVKLV